MSSSAKVRNSGLLFQSNVCKLFFLVGFCCCPYYQGSHQRESVIAGVCFNQTSVICFSRGFSYRPYYRDARYREVSARRELTVFALAAPVVGSSLYPTDVRDLCAPISRQRLLFHVVIYLLFV